MTAGRQARQDALPPALSDVRLGPIAWRFNRRVLVLIAGATAGFVALAAWALTLGSYPLALDEVLATLRGAGQPRWDFVVFELRLPRVTAAALVGSMLAMAGAIFQGIVRNPLVSPDIIGINAGAALCSVFWIVNGLAWAFVPVAALVGSVAAGAAVYLLSWRGHIAPQRLVLVGIGLNAMLSAGTTLLLVRAELEAAQEAVLWMAGSLYGSGWAEVQLLAVAAALLLPLGTALMSGLRVLQLGDETALSVGMPVERFRLLLLLLGCSLAAVPVSLAGPIGFVALMVPHLARMLAGPMSGGVFVLTGALGAILVLGADMLGQHGLPVGLPVGVLTAVLGAPYFLYLIYRTHTRL